ncbi:S8 family serine peptidase [Agarivorans aestuarii]|uniref:S8 family serine peptidase n=1 Tax=Agarivorans aestuarii TaxID=1563703 RepID=A0ABU7G627_9ALTE|nr:S8 family serine peptidase [Agarivorans aestuarii]MEE1674619.1 S8 family serine peptidase [Agarivorans aestuarii]
MKAIVAVLLSTILLACGGGGGDSGSSAGSPNSAISVNRSEAVIGQLIQFDGSGSSDDGTIVDYTWDFGDGSGTSGISVSKSYANDGNYTVRLTVLDNDNLSSSSSTVIQVTNDAASALTILSSESAGTPPLDVNFQAISTASDLSNVQVNWEFGDGNSSTSFGSNAVSHTYATEGVFMVRASRDFEGQEQVAETRVLVLDGKTYPVSGTVTTAVNTVVDSDVNDIGNEYIANNSYADAQALPPIATVSGYLASHPTGDNKDRFANVADERDVYRVDLQANQRLFLEIADWETGGNDFDLRLINADTMFEVNTSMGVNKTEILSVDQTGSYYLVVEAYIYSNTAPFRGNYTLRLIGQSSAALPESKHFSTQQDFLSKQMVVMHQAGRAASLSTQDLGLTQTQSSANMSLYLSNDQQAVALNSTSGDGLGAQFTDEYAAKRSTLLDIKRLHYQLGGEEQLVSPNYLYHPFALSNDPLVSRQWHYEQINLDSAWQLMQNSSLNNVVVAVIDTGIFQNHSDLKNQLTTDGYDFISDASNARDGDGIDANPEDPGDLTSPGGGSSWHGTHVAGTVAAQTDNALGVAGVAPNTKIMNLRTLGRYGGSTWDISQAILYAAGLSNASGRLPSQTADVINMSLGGSGYDSAFDSVTQQAIASGVIVVAAAGNESTSQFSYPAAFTNVIGVSAVDAAKDLTSYSNYGSYIDVAAPGGDSSADLNGDGYGDGVYSTYVAENGSSNSASYQYLNGTSMAAPHVAGVIGLMRQLNSELSTDDVLNLLAQGEISDDIGSDGFDQLYGYGLINAEKAVRSQLDADQPDRSALSLSTNQVSLSFIEDSAEVSVELIGSASLSVNSVRSNASWLTVSTKDVDENGVGDYLLSVNRNGLSDGNYGASVVFSVSNGSELSLGVSMNVSNVQAGDSGLVYVLLSDPETGSTYYEQSVNMNNGEFSFRFAEVLSGEYELTVGSNHDNDYLICDEGELCGAYPLRNNVTPILVTEEISGLSLSIEPITTEDLTNQVVNYKLLK